MLTLLVLALRGVIAIAVLTTLVGGIPRVVQLGLAITLGVWSAVMLAPGAIEPTWVIALQEVAIGAALGVMSAVPLLAAIAAGQLVDLAGTSRAQGPYSVFFGVLAASVFVGVDGHVTVMLAIVESHQRMAALATSASGVLAVIATLVPAAVKLAVPWLVTAAVVQIAVGAGTRVAATAGAHMPGAAAVPAALTMMTASLVATLAIAMGTFMRAAAA
jgi:flagellar biosynthesis protein FliR